MIRHLFTGFVASVSRRALGAAVWAAPESFQERYGAELLETHEDVMRAALDRGLWATLRVATRDVLGAFFVVLRLRLGPTPDRTPNSQLQRSNMFDSVSQDTRYALRVLARNPGFSATVVLVLALGIGGVTAIFSVVNAYLFRPLPIAAEDRVVTIYETNPEFEWDDATAAPANALDWREQVDAFLDLAMYSDFTNDATLVQDGEPVLLGGNGVTGNFFTVAGVPPALGRDFRWDETWAPDNAVVMLSHRAWTSVFASDPGVVGRTIELSGRTAEVVGVMPQGFNFPSDDVDFWTPMGWQRTDREAVWFRRAHFMRPLARLAPGVTVAEADAQLQVVVQRLQTDYPVTNRVMGAGLMPVREFLIRDVRRPLGILAAAVSLLLLLACTNVATLMLVRASERTREVAVRVALGAGRSRVARQMLTESFLLALLGGIAGLGVGWLAVQGIQLVNELGIEGATSVALDTRVLVATFAITTLSGLLFGLGPALRRTAPAAELKESGRASTSSRRRLRSGNLLVGAEVALALLLVVGAGLVLRSFIQLRNVDPGFEVEGVLSVHLSTPEARYAEREDVLAFWSQLTENLEARPGIERVGGVGQLPLAGQGWSGQLKAEAWPEDRYVSEIVHRRADRGYFEALDIPLIAGRHFEPADRDGPLVIVINEQMAEEHFPGENPIGQRVAYDQTPDENSNWYEIVGIVGNQHQNSLAQPARAEAFENREQDWGRNMRLVVRTEQDPMSVLPIVRSVLDEIDPLVPIAEPTSLRRVWRGSIAQEELILSLLGGFGLIALLIAAVGVYGVTARAARRRTHEIGIRIALGAARRDILKLVLLQGVGVVAVGIGVGLVAALLSTRAMSSLLFGVEPNDPATLIGVVVLLGGVALLASYLPAIRSTRIDPLSSLRAD